MPGSSAVSPPIRAQPACAAHVGRSFDELRHLFGVDAVGGDVVEQEQRVGAGGEHVVDAVRSEVGAAPAQAAGATGEHELRPDAVGGGDEQPSLVDLDDPGERAERADDGGGACRGDGGGESLDDAVGGGEGDPGVGVRALVGHASSLRRGQEGGTVRS